MPKLYSGEKIIKALIRAGFYTVSIKGSHVKLRGGRIRETSDSHRSKTQRSSRWNFQKYFKASCNGARGIKKVH